MKIVLPEFECAVTPVSLVYASHRLIPLKLRAFIDFAAPRLTERLKAIATVMDVAPLVPKGRRSIARARQ